MKSKISLCNRTIFRKDIRRLWPLWVLETIVMQLLITLPLLSTCLSYKNNVNYDSSQKYTHYMTLINIKMHYMTFPMLIAVISCISAVLVFGYLTNTREAYMIHSFPISRTTLFASHYLAGAAMIIIPVIATYALLLLITASFVPILVMSVIGCMLETIIEVLLFYSMACMVVMISGNTIMSMVIYGVLNVLYIGIMVMLSGICYFTVYGCEYLNFMNNSVEVMPYCFLTPVFGLLNFVGIYPDSSFLISEYSMDYSDNIIMNINNFGMVCLYLIPAVLFAVVALILYKKRPIEHVGDMVAFRWCRPVFRFVFTFCGGLLFANMIYMAYTVGSGVKSSSKLIEFGVLIFIGCIVSYIISEMILSKTFMVWKHIAWLRVGIISAAVVVVSFVARFTYINAGIPDTDEIVCVEIGTENSNVTYKDAAHIEQLQDIQQDIIKAGQGTEDYDQDLTYIDLTYHLEDGTYVYRTYSITFSEADKLLDMINTISDMKETLFSSSYKDINIENMYLYSADEDMSDQYEVALQDDRSTIYEALLKDIDNGAVTIANYYTDSDMTQYAIDIGETKYYLNFEFSFPQEIRSKLGEEYADTLVTSTGNDRIIINEKCTNTIKAIEELKKADRLNNVSYTG